MDGDDDVGLYVFDCFDCFFKVHCVCSAYGEEGDVDVFDGEVRHFVDVVGVACVVEFEVACFEDDAHAFSAGVEWFAGVAEAVVVVCGYGSYLDAVCLFVVSGVDDAGFAVELSYVASVFCDSDCWFDGESVDCFGVEVVEVWVCDDDEVCLGCWCVDCVFEWVDVGDVFVF